jgi:hypothetical protein
VSRACRSRAIWADLHRGRAAWLAACLAGPLVTPAHALDAELGRQSGAVLLSRCEAALSLVQGSDAGTVDTQMLVGASACIGFVDGFIFGHGWAAWRENRDMYYCPPEGFSAAEALAPLVEYLRAHGDRLDAPAHVLVFAALSHAFPCTPPTETK